MEKVSVIVPVYNAENYLEECLNSIVNQTYHNLEIILVDDGSTDRSSKICDDYALKDSRIKVIHKENGGLSDARNVGIENSTADYITWVDHDDVITFDYVEVLYKVLVENDADISMCGHQRFIDKIEIIKKPYTVRKLSNAEALEKFGGVNAGISVYVWSKLYKRALILQYKFNSDMTDDISTTYKYFSDAKKIYYINKVLYFHRNLPNSLGKKESDSRKKLQAIAEVALYLEERNIRNKYIIHSYLGSILAQRRKAQEQETDLDLKELREKYIRVLKLYRSSLRFGESVKYHIIYLLWNFNYYRFYSKEEGFKIWRK